MDLEKALLMIDDMRSAGRDGIDRHVAFDSVAFFGNRKDLEMLDRISGALYAEIDHLASWARMDLPDPGDYGDDAVELHRNDKLEQHSYYLTLGSLGSIIIASFSMSLPAVLCGCVAAISSVSAMLSARSKADYPDLDSNLEKYADAVVMYHSYSRRFTPGNENGLQLSMELYQIALDTIVGLFRDLGYSDNATAALTAERQRVKEFRKSYDDIVLAISGSKPSAPISRRSTLSAFITGQETWDDMSAYRLVLDMAKLSSAGADDIEAIGHRKDTPTTYH